MSVVRLAEWKDDQRAGRWALHWAAQKAATRVESSVERWAVHWEQQKVDWWDDQ